MLNPASDTLLAIVGRSRFPVQSWAQVSAAYRKTIDALGIGASRTPRCLIVNADGVIVAHVSYNGRVWIGENYEPGAQPLFDPSMA